MRRYGAYFLVLVGVICPILSLGQTVVLTTPTVTVVFNSTTGFTSTNTYTVSPSSAPVARRYVVNTLMEQSTTIGTVTVLDSLAASTVFSLSDGWLNYVGIGNLFDDGHDGLVVYSSRVATGYVKIIDLQTGATRYTENCATSNSYISVTLTNYSNRTKPEVAVTYITKVGDISASTTTYVTKIYRFFTPSTGGIPQSGELPQKMSLSQNYPNPFNPTTTIEYELPSGGSPRVDIFDLNGALIRSFDLLGQQAGSNRLVWDGRNMVGSQVASGPYFYQLTSGGTTQQKKMLLLR